MIGFARLIVIGGWLCYGLTVWSLAQPAVSLPESTPDEPAELRQAVAAGAAEARADLAANRARFLGWGLAAMGADQGHPALERDYGVRIDWVAGCVVSEPEVARWEAYNRTVAEALTGGMSVWELEQRLRLRDWPALYGAVERSAQGEPLYLLLRPSPGADEAIWIYLGEAAFTGFQTEIADLPEAERLARPLSPALGAVLTAVPPPRRAG